jgi:purine-binding chemotaxis protein CheW
VQEVLREQPLTRVPLAPPVVEGLLNLRGQIVPALDLRRVLRLAPRQPGAKSMSIVAQTSDGPVSLQVDEIGDVVETGADTFEEPPDNLPPVARQLIRGVHKLNDRLLLVLDTSRVAGAASLRQGEEPFGAPPEQ